MDLSNFFRKLKQKKAEVDNEIIEVETLEDKMRERKEKGINEIEEEAFLDKVKNFFQTFFSKKNPA